MMKTQTQHLAADELHDQLPEQQVDQHIQLLDEIRDEAQELASTYLTETIVPEGGE